MKILFEHPYGEPIKNFFNKELELIPSSKKELLEVLTELLINTNQYRSTPRPNVESQFEIRKVIKRAIDTNSPIPILIPWGGKKMDGGLIDIAELMTFKIIGCLQKKVSNIYEPGLRMNLRAEDTGAYWLFRDDFSKFDLNESIETYMNDLKKLRTIMGFDFLKIVPESNMMDTQEYINVSDTNSKVILEVLKHPDIFKPDLKKIGWSGDLPKEQIDYYIGRYTKLYPNDSLEKQLIRLADYFGGSLARYQLNGVGIEPEWKDTGYIAIKLVPPVPGAPEGLVSRDLYYRSIPKKFSEYVMPPWRSKGYLSISEKDEVIPKITSFHDVKNYETGLLKLVSDDGIKSLDMRADIVFK